MHICLFIVNDIQFSLDPSKGYKGITCFVVEKDMGIKIEKKESKVVTISLIFLCNIFIINSVF
jgi:hypothetical protein